MNDLRNCWDLLKCARQKNGSKVAEFGECVASREQLGHSCWAIAGTLCGGEVQGTVAEKQAGCMKCAVYRKYHRAVGSEGKLIKEHFPEEDKKYADMLIQRWNSRL